MATGTHFETLALMGKLPVAAVQETIRDLVARLQARGHRVLLEDEASGFGLSADGTLSPAALAEAADLVISVGGDGTMLRAAHATGPAGTPLVGVNLGHLGFLTDIGVDDLGALDAILDGRFVEDPRCMLEGRAERDGASLGEAVGLNDFVIQRWDVGRMIEFETWVGGRFVSAHRADGLVVATPTGSTAYSLSAGGPILQPQLATLLLVPISPHTLSDRPLVISSGEEIELRITGRELDRGQLLCDARDITELLPGDSIRIRLAAQPQRLLHPEGYDYFSVLRSKMHWAGGNGGGSGVAR